MDTFIRKEFLLTCMSETQAEKPDVITVSSKGQITIPSSLRRQYDLEEGDRLIAVPLEEGIMLKKIDLPSVEEFQERVETREVELSLEDIVDIVHEQRNRR